MAEIDRAQLRIYLDRPLDELEQELALYDLTSRGPKETWAKVSGKVHGWLCDDWGWCREREKGNFDDLFDLGIAVAVVLSKHIGEMPLDADECLIAAIVVKRGMDRFCGC